MLSLVYKTRVRIRLTYGKQ